MNEAAGIRTRVHGPRRLQQELRRLVIKTHRCQVGRELTDDERIWTGKLFDLLKRLIDEGDEVIASGPDPRDRRRARKRPGQLF
jgi:hypothetical protein